MNTRLMNQDRKESKRVTKSIRNQIFASGLCPLVVMWKVVSVLSLGGYNPIMVANTITVVLLVGIYQLLYVAHNIVKPIRQAEECIIQIANGNLDISIDEKMRKRKDEIGSMFESLTVLRDKLKDAISDIQKISEKRVSSEGMLERIVGETSVVTGQIESAVQIISDDEKKQYDENQSLEIMNNLDESNEQTNNAIERSNKQVHSTYEASVRINDVIQMITSIVKHTILLALNVSIEAARAGEHGRGFSVVAEEISKLTNQSSEFAKEIDTIIGDLSTESGKMLEMMNEVLADVEKQREKLVETQVHFEKMNDGIGVSLQEILVIRAQTKTCDAAREKIMAAIEVLRKISEDSVYSMNDTRKFVTVLNQNISEMELTAALLKDYAETLNN